VNADEWGALALPLVAYPENAVADLEATHD